MPADLGAVISVVALLIPTGPLDIPRDSVELTAGPRVRVEFDPAVWKPLAPLAQPQPGAGQSMTWAIDQARWLQITVASRPERETDDEHRKQLLMAQKFRGDPADLVRERRGKVADRDWQVLEFRNASTRPPRSEIHYFLQTADGCASLFVICDEADLAEHRGAIDAFLGKIRLR
ncbi:MAG: hypothetical protein U0800_24255 [Isosphaeraceae bacterium]